MTTGMETLNDGRIVQVDENYRNLVFVQKFTFASTGDHSFNLTGRTSPVLVLYSTDANGIVLQQSSNSSGSWTWRVNGNGEAYVFDVPPAPTAHGSGLQVFTASSQSIFDSNNPPLIVRAFRQWAGPSAFTYYYPTQTLSTAPDYYGTSVVEDTSLGSYPAFTKPSNQKWGWIVTGGFTCVYFENLPSSGGPPSGDGKIHRGQGALHASGNSFQATFRDTIYTGTYWNGGGNWSTYLAMVDLTNIG